MSVPCVPSVPIVLTTFKCPHCITREHSEFLLDDNMPALPSDTVAVPEAYSICKRPEEMVRINPSYPKKEKLKNLRFRLDGELGLQFFVYGNVLFESKESRKVQLKGVMSYKFRHNAKYYYRLDDALVKELECDPDVCKVRGKVYRFCVAQLRRLRASPDGCLADYWRDNTQHLKQQKVLVDTGALNQNLENVLLAIHQNMGDAGVTRVRQRMDELFGADLRAPEAAQSFAQKPDAFLRDTFWVKAQKNAREPFGLTGNGAGNFRDAQALGDRRGIHFTYVGQRPDSAVYNFEFAPGSVWQKDGEGTKNLNTLRRVLWMIQDFPKERLERFAAQFSEEDMKELGLGGAYVLREGAIGSYVLRREGGVTIVDPMQFMRDAFLGCFMYTSTVLTKDIRKAICMGNLGSLAAKILEARPGAREELDHLSGLYVKLFDAADEVHKLKQMKRSDIADDLPTAESVLLFMRDLDWKLDKTAEELYLLAFLGLAFFLGLRSGEMGILVKLGFRNTDLGNYNKFTVNKDGKLIFSSFQCKTHVSDLKNIPLPDWLERWVREYDRVRHSLLKGQPHDGMWVTSTGLPTHDSLRGEDKDNHGGGNFNYIVSLLKKHFGQSSITNFTRIRAVFFGGLSEDVPGSMLNLFAHSQDYSPHQLDATVPALKDKEGIKLGMSVLFRSKSQEEYTKKCRTPMEDICKRLDAVKRYLWDQAPAA